MHISKVQSIQSRAWRLSPHQAAAVNFTAFRHVGIVVWPPLPAVSPWKGASIGVTAGTPPTTDMAQPHVCRTGLLKSQPYKLSSDQIKPQLYKKQGNIMQDHRKSEETAFWAGLARSLCELQLTSKARSLAPNSAENIPSAAKDNTPHVFASGLRSRTPCT